MNELAINFVEGAFCFLGECGDLFDGFAGVGHEGFEVDGGTTRFVRCAFDVGEGVADGGYVSLGENVGVNLGDGLVELMGGGVDLVEGAIKFLEAGVGVFHEDADITGDGEGVVLNGFEAACSCSAEDGVFCDLSGGGVLGNGDDDEFVT